MHSLQGASGLHSDRDSCNIAPNTTLDSLQLLSTQGVGIHRLLEVQGPYLLQGQQNLMRYEIAPDQCRRNQGLSEAADVHIADAARLEAKGDASRTLDAVPCLHPEGGSIITYSPDSTMSISSYLD